MMKWVFRKGCLRETGDVVVWYLSDCRAAQVYDDRSEEVSDLSLGMLNMEVCRNCFNLGDVWLVLDTPRDMTDGLWLCYVGIMVGEKLANVSIDMGITPAKPVIDVLGIRIPFTRRSDVLVLGNVVLSGVGKTGLFPYLLWVRPHGGMMDVRLYTECGDYVAIEVDLGSHRYHMRSRDGLGWGDWYPGVGEGVTSGYPLLFADQMNVTGFDDSVSVAGYGNDGYLFFGEWAVPFHVDLADILWVGSDVFHLDIQLWFDTYPVLFEPVGNGVYHVYLSGTDILDSVCVVDFWLCLDDVNHTYSVCREIGVVVYKGRMLSRGGIAKKLLLGDGMR